MPLVSFPGLRGQEEVRATTRQEYVHPRAWTNPPLNPGYPAPRGKAHQGSRTTSFQDPLTLAGTAERQFPAQGAGRGGAEPEGAGPRPRGGRRGRDGRAAAFLWRDVAGPGGWEGGVPA